MKIPSSEHGENMLCTEIVFGIQDNFCTQHVLPIFCKNKSFWQRFICKSMDNCWISCQLMAVMKKVCDDLIIINLLCIQFHEISSFWIKFIEGLKLKITTDYISWNHGSRNSITKNFCLGSPDLHLLVFDLISPFKLFQCTANRKFREGKNLVKSQRCKINKVH